MNDLSEYKFCKDIKISNHAFITGLYHSLLTDEEEIMGLLIGISTNQNINKEQSIHVLSTISLNRNCKEKDRVEFDEIKLAEAIQYTEELNLKYNLKSENKIKIVGWYHSHPKITYPPSHIDLNTQYSQQYQGTFIGLIFSVFDKDKLNTNKINLISVTF